MSLRHLLDQRVHTPEQEACLPKLLGYQFKVEHKPGNINQAIDALSCSILFTLSTARNTFMDCVYDTVKRSLDIQDLSS